MEQSNNENQQNDNMETRVHRHSKVITGFRTLDDKLHWRYNTRNLFSDEDESIEVRFFVLLKNVPAPLQGDAYKTLLKQVENDEVTWLSQGRKEWVFDLDRMKAEFKGLQELDWCEGRVYIEPEFIVEKEDVDISGKKFYETFIVFYINPKVLGMTPLYQVPVEIQQSLREFRLDHPDPKKAAFILMRFGKTSAHNNIVQGIKDALAPHGISAVRADDKDWHSDVYYNILTCIYGCSFGIAVFERIEQDDFNPNVAFEVGYMTALAKQVCLLKDKNLKGLHTDLIGKLYKTFDPLDSITTIPPELTKWMQDKKLI
jgi:hypothetical protein